MRKSDKLKQNPFERSQTLTQDFFDVPLLGMVHASLSSSGKYNLNELVTNFQNIDQNSITLEVLDNAMRKAGILKGDFLTIDLQEKPKDNDIVVIKLGERFYVRRFFREDHLIRLETSDHYPSSIIIDEKTPGFQIIGKVLSISRQF